MQSQRAQQRAVASRRSALERKGDLHNFSFSDDARFGEFHSNIRVGLSMWATSVPRERDPEEPASYLGLDSGRHELAEVVIAP